MNAIPLIRALGLPLATLAAVLIAGLIAWVFLNDAHSSAAHTHQQAQQQHRAQAAALAASQATTEEATTLNAQLPALKAAGLLDTPNRLDWIDALRTTRETHRLYKIDYEIAPQQNADALLIDYPGPEWRWYATSMQLQLAALHEEDLLNTLQDLRTQTRPWLHIKACTLTRLEGASDTQLNPKLDARCELQWIHAQRAAEAPKP